MNFKNYKEEYTSKKIQCIEIDLEGEIISSDNAIFEVNPAYNLKTISPFFESLVLMWDTLESETLFSCVELIQDKKELLLDVTVIKKRAQILLIIYDFTTHYKEANVLIQERNESTISKNHLFFEKELLIEKEKLKNTFLEKISHELRNPLSDILGLVSIIADSRVNNEQAQMLSIIKKTGGHLEALLNDLLDIAKISRGKLVIKQVSFKIKDITTHLNELFQIKAKQQQIKLAISIDKSVPKFLVGDPTRLKQILINLLENAFNHTEKGEVSLVIKQQRTTVEKTIISFKVQDTGSGIKATEIPKIFDEYYQTEKLLSQSNRVGLGLKIVEELVQFQDGSVKVYSFFGEGSTFTVNIPYKIFKSKNKEKKKIVQKARKGLYNYIKVLLVDDSKTSQMILAKMLLAEESFIVDFAFNGEMALNILNKNKYDVLLVDIEMPTLDGYQFIEFVKRNEKTYDIPIIVLSGKAFKKDKEKALRLGAKTFITKPYNKKHLLKEIKSATS